jgi:hypothetical protein
MHRRFAMLVLIALSIPSTVLVRGVMPLPVTKFASPIRAVRCGGASSFAAFVRTRSWGQHSTTRGSSAPHSKSPDPTPVTARQACSA